MTTGPVVEGLGSVRQDKDTLYEIWARQVDDRYGVARLCGARLQ